MANKKRIATTLGAMALTAVIAVGGTLAYLSSITETKKNMFTGSENITTELTEEKWEKGKEYTPGESLFKNPVIHNLGSGSSAVSMYTGVKVQFFDNDDQKISYNTFIQKYGTIRYLTNGSLDDPNFEVDTAIYADGFNPAWTPVAGTLDSTEGVFLNYTKEGGIVAPGTATEAVFDQVVVNVGITKVWNKTYETTKAYEVKKDENGNFVKDENGNYVPDLNKEISSTTTQSESARYVDASGNLVTDAFKLPKFQIDVTGYAVQSTNVTAAEAQAQLMDLAGLK